jgi:hypothetical protein
MQADTKERFLKLCEQAATEQDAARLMALIREICQMLEDKEERLQKQKAEGTSC